MFSWFPIFFPLRKPIQCNQLMQIIFDIKRKVDKNGIWYEWKIDYNVIFFVYFFLIFNFLGTK